MIELNLEWWQWLLAVIVGVVGAARLTRIITYDDYPPAMALRAWWQKKTGYGPWSKLATCSWCAGPWVTAAMIGSFALSFLHPALGWCWWIFWGWLCLSYWVSQYVYFDQGKSD